MDVLNLIGVIFVATLAGFIVGMLWYSKVLFGRAWMALSKVDSRQWSRIAMTLGGFGIQVLISIGLLFAIGMTGVHPYVVALCLWLTTFFPVVLHGKVYNGRSWKLVLIDGGHYLVALLASATVYLFL